MRAWVPILIAVVVGGCASRRVHEREGGAEALLAEAGLTDCLRDEARSDELLIICPDAVVMGVKDLPRQSPEQVFAGYLAEARAAVGEVELLNQEQVKLFGPQVTAVRMILHRAEAPEGTDAVVYVGACDRDGGTRRVWCSASPDQPAGIGRCEDRLMWLAVP